MRLNTNNPSTPHRMAGFVLALGAGIATYAWRRKVTKRPVLHSLASAIAIATGTGTTIGGLARRFLLNSDVDPLPVDGRLAEMNDEHLTPRKGEENYR